METLSELVFNSIGNQGKDLREHLRTRKSVPYLGHSFLHCIDFNHEFHIQIKEG